MSGVIHALGGLGGGDVVVAGEVANVTRVVVLTKVDGAGLKNVAKMNMWQKNMWLNKYVVKKL